jgi:uncharacterized protein
MSKTLSKRCPECSRRFRYRSVEAHAPFPFCSERCKTIDLGRWFRDEYAVVEDVSRDHDLVLGDIDPDDIDDPDLRQALKDLKE